MATTMNNTIKTDAHGSTTRRVAKSDEKFWKTAGKLKDQMETTASLLEHFGCNLNIYRNDLNKFDGKLSQVKKELGEMKTLTSEMLKADSKQSEAKPAEVMLEPIRAEIADLAAKIRGNLENSRIYESKDPNFDMHAFISSIADVTPAAGIKTKKGQVFKVTLKDGSGYLFGHLENLANLIDHNPSLMTRVREKSIVCFMEDGAKASSWLAPLA